LCARRADRPPRAALFGDASESLRAFAPITQRWQADLAQLDGLPAREFSLQHAAELAERLATAGWDQLGGSAPQAPYALAPYTELVDKLREGSYAPGADAFAPALGATASLLDHLGDRASVIFEDTVELELAHDALEAQAEERRDELAELGLAVSVFPPPYVPRSRIDEAAERHGVARMGPTGDALRLGWSSATSYAGRLTEFIEHIAASL